MCFLSGCKDVRVCGEAFCFVEFFSGEGNLTWALMNFGFPGLHLDADYGGRYNNIFEPAGMGWPPYARQCIRAIV